MSRRVRSSQLLDLRATVFDIRSREEREVMGWIPGSLHRPGTTPGSLKALEGTVVLACASGRRSLALASEVDLPHILDLEGGLLAWQNDHPICTFPEGPPPPRILRRDDFVRQIRSCFVVESVESGAIDTDEADPLDAVSTILDGIARDRELGQVWARIDGLAHEAWGQGHRADFIAEHVTQFYALAREIDLG